MVVTLSVILATLFCSLFHCELGANPPFIYVGGREPNRLIPSTSGRGRSFTGDDDPLVYTSLGRILGYRLKIWKNREIFAFTGVPYGEPPVGKLRFANPVPKKPWKKSVLQAMYPSPSCIQSEASAGGMLTGQEDCLHVDIYSPRIPTQNVGYEGPGLPVIVWTPGGMFMNGKSYFYGPAYFMREDIILVNVNVRLGVFGFLTTGDELCPGNWELKDFALAVEFVYNNIRAFGGDPNRITVGGISSGAMIAQALLFSKHKAKDYIKGVIALSGSVFSNIGLDTVGRTKNASDLISRSSGCPGSTNGRSRDMVDCLRNMDAYDLASFQFTPYITLPPLSLALGPVLEPDVPGAFLTELPEHLYEKGEVPPLPLIVSRTEDEISFLLQTPLFLALSITHLNWDQWMPKVFHTVGFRISSSHFPKSEKETQKYLSEVSQLYFNKTTPPILLYNPSRLRAMISVINDNMFNAPALKLIEMHHKIAPTYAYLLKQNGFAQQPFFDVLMRVQPIRYGAPHASDYFLLFSNTHNIPLLKPGSDIEKTSRNLIHFLANFAAFGEPKYRTATGIFLSPWRPIKSMNESLVLEVGLVDKISMIRDPLFTSERYKIWDRVKF